MFLARMITRHKWQPKDGLAANEIPADAITADLRTANNTLSFWQCGRATDLEVSDAVLAIAAGRDRIQKLDIVWILTDEMKSDGQRIRLKREGPRLPDCPSVTSTCAIWTTVVWAESVIGWQGRSAKSIGRGSDGDRLSISLLQP